MKQSTGLDIEPLGPQNRSVPIRLVNTELDKGFWSLPRPRQGKSVFRRASASSHQVVSDIAAALQLENQVSFSTGDALTQLA